ncbi:hypothetical protein GUITHDRAFT_106730 [Guillardia theta CCMP2712]|uniref:Uncharacterized protein n=1 Tax=Guillardia theta (strain CCMP2712) TaxID=905079 RepID=L1JGT4_GUITC|nr:hypothetical protein GUITHDRAFT_106730 [Guillardia theta CCMP2712]EKX47280.1 hypothetical protein GUITHDRAFT_106730 [Guillardia theta CCMP2712]|eukprot:XP_005834260.1 hypothetical protein GUITHDRAFT_106730 [Guillardia theta CCMP2712]
MLVQIMLLEPSMKLAELARHVMEEVEGSGPAFEVCLRIQLAPTNVQRCVFDLISSRWDELSLSLQRLPTSFKHLMGGANTLANERLILDKENVDAIAKAFYDFHVKLMRACVLHPPRPAKLGGTAKTAERSGRETCSGSETDMREKASPNVTPHKRKREAASLEEREEKQQSNRGTSTSDAELLSDKETLSLQHLKTALRALKPHAKSSDLPQALKDVVKMERAEQAWNSLKMEELGDDLFCLVSDHILDDSSGHREASCYMRNVFVPRIKLLAQPASRVLLGTIMNAVTRHSHAARDSFVLPLLEHPDLGTAQIEVLTRVIKEGFTAQTQLALLDALLDVVDMKRGSLTDAAQPHPFQHAHVAIVHSILLLKPPIPQVSLGKLVIMLVELVRRERDCNAPVMLQSLKFSNLVLAIVSKYGSEVTASIDNLDEVADLLCTTLKKPIKSMISRIKSR